MDIESLEAENDKSIDALGDRVGLLKKVPSSICIYQSILRFRPAQHFCQYRCTVSSRLSFVAKDFASWFEIYWTPLLASEVVKLLTAADLEHQVRSQFSASGRRWSGEVPFRTLSQVSSSLIGSNSCSSSSSHAANPQIFRFIIVLSISE